MTATQLTTRFAVSYRTRSWCNVDPTTRQLISVDVASRCFPHINLISTCPSITRYYKWSLSFEPFQIIYCTHFWTLSCFSNFIPVFITIIIFSGVKNFLNSQFSAFTLLSEALELIRFPRGENPNSRSAIDEVTVLCLSLFSLRMNWNGKVATSTLHFKFSRIFIANMIFVCYCPKIFKLCYICKWFIYYKFAANHGLKYTRRSGLL